MKAVIRQVQSPIGKITLAASANGLIMCSTGVAAEDLMGQLMKKGVTFSSDISDAAALEILNKAAKALDNYFRGELSSLLSVPLDPIGTEFQLQIWRELLNIRGSELASYKEVAKSVSNEDAVRAVGTACGSNPLHLFIPCHRVVSISGNLTGYKGGLDKKKWLVDFERSVAEDGRESSAFA